MDKIKRAYKIAQEALRACYDDHGIFAGRHHYTDYWIRDGSFASFGALRLGDFDIVKKQLLLFIKFQKADGQIPVRIGNKNTIFKLLGFKMKKDIFPMYHHDKRKDPPSDSASLFLIASERYIKTTNDSGFAEKYLSNFENAHKWNMTVSENYLLKEGNYANFADSIKKMGYCLYTNVCFCKSVNSLARIYKLLKLDKKAKEMGLLYLKIRKEINKIFWNGKYYIDWIDAGKKYDFFSTDGNMLAIITGIADRAKTKSIITYFDKLKLDQPVPCKTNYPTYPKNLIWPLLFLLGMHDYHNNSMAWLWLGCIEAIAKFKINKKEALKVLEEIADIIVKFNEVYEVYEKSGKPVNRLFYKAEHPFAWNSGLFIEASHIIAKDKIGNII